MAPIPPYDVVIFFVVWIISAISWFGGQICRRKQCCCACDNAVCSICCEGHPYCSDTKFISSANNSSSSSSSLSNNNDAELAAAGLGPAAATQPYGSVDPAKSSSAAGAAPELSAKDIGVRTLIGVLSTFVLSFILTIIIMAILGSAGFLSMLLFSPAKSSTCSPSCTFTTKDGLPGWVDETCCTYNPVGLGEFYDVFLQFQQGGGAKTSFKIHGWVMVNRTRHFSAPPSQPPMMLMYNHGSGGNVGSGYRIERYKFLLEQGNVVVVVYDYPEYGKSSGTASSSSVMESGRGVSHWMSQYLAQNLLTNDDLQGAVFSSTSTVPNSGGSALNNTVVPLGVSLENPFVQSTGSAAGEGADMSRLVVLGRSMGGAVATYTSKNAKVYPRAILIQSTFSKLATLAAYYFPMFSWVWTGQANSEFGDYSNVLNIAGVSKCMYHSHSEADEWVPFSEGEAIHEVAMKTYKATCSKWVVAKNAIHTQPLTVVERGALDAWLKSSDVRGV